MSELLLSKWDLQSQTNWRMYAVDGFNILAADVASLAAAEKQRVLDVHPDLQEPQHRVVEQYNNEKGRYEWTPQTEHEVEHYNDETGEYEYIRHPIEPSLDHNSLYQSWDYYVTQLPDDAYRIYEWIYRELKKRRMPWPIPEVATTADREAAAEQEARAMENGWDYEPRQYGVRRKNVAVPTALHEDLTNMIPAPEVEDEEEDALAQADAAHNPERNERGTPRRDLSVGLRNYPGEERFFQEMSHSGTLQYLRGFVQAMRWLAEKNRPFPDYKSRNFTFPIMVRWLQAFDTSVNDPEQRGPEYTNNDRVMHTLSNGWRIEIRDNAADCGVEGEYMGHCVGGYGDMVESGRTAIFSLVDKRGYPHATMQFQQDLNGQELPYPGIATQIRGKQNVAPVPGYIELIKEWINSVPHRVYWLEGHCMNQTLRRQAGDTYLFNYLIENLGTLKQCADDLRSNPDLLGTTVTKNDLGPDEYGLYLTARQLPGRLSVSWTYFGENLATALLPMFSARSPQPYQQQQPDNQENVRAFLTGIFDDLYLAVAVGHRNYQAIIAAGVSVTNIADPFAEEARTQFLYYARDPRVQEILGAYYDRYFGNGVETMPETGFQPQLFEARWRPRWHRPASHWQRPLRGFFSSARM